MNGLDDFGKTTVTDRCKDSSPGLGNTSASAASRQFQTSSPTVINGVVVDQNLPILLLSLSTSIPVCLQFTFIISTLQGHSTFPKIPISVLLDLLLESLTFLLLRKSNTHNLRLVTLCSNHNAVASPDPSADDLYPPPDRKDPSRDVNNFWGSVSLIIGTAVGPGMLGLPAATIRSGPLPSSIVILLSYVYVVSSIILVAELSFAAMEEDGVQEVSFTGLVTKAFSPHFGAFVALVYASLTFSLLVACVSGIGSIVHHCFPAINPIAANALFPFLVGVTIIFFPFDAIDGANRVLCSIMLFSIAALVAFGLSVARRNIIASFGFSSWRVSSILPAIPITVLTLGFHVITPFVCKLCRHNRGEALRAIVFGGAVPLVMVLSWNLIVLAISGSGAAASGRDPISLLLSVNPSASSAVHLFAFSALATSLIGYAVSFPKQLVDTMKLILDQHIGRSSGSESETKASREFSRTEFGPPRILMLMFVVGSPVIVASFFQSAFSRALEFAGVYANCFLFGILPPIMAYIHKLKNKTRISDLAGGDGSLFLLLGVALILGICH